jgi:dihydroneopterin aldolase
VDIIFLHEYKLALVIGVYEWERRLPQTVQLDIEIGLPSSRAGETDRVEDTIDYGKVIEAIDASVQQHHFDILEALAEHIAHLIRTDFKAPWVRLSITKLGMLRHIKRVGLIIERGSRS